MIDEGLKALIVKIEDYSTDSGPGYQQRVLLQVKHSENVHLLNDGRSIRNMFRFILLFCFFSAKQSRNDGNGIIKGRRSRREVVVEARRTDINAVHAVQKVIIDEPMTWA